jgi:hypothetical protein
MRITCSGFEVETVINVRIARAGLRIAEVPSTEHERIHGESNLNAVRDGLRVLRAIIAERLRRRPHRDADWRPSFRELPPDALRDGAALAIGPHAEFVAGDWDRRPITITRVEGAATA